MGFEVSKPGQNELEILAWLNDMPLSEKNLKPKDEILKMLEVPTVSEKDLNTKDLALDKKHLRPKT